MKTEEYVKMIQEMERIIESLQIDNVRKELINKEVAVDDFIKLIKERTEKLHFNLVKAKFYLAGAIENLKDEELDKYKLELCGSLKDKIIKYEEKIKEQENYMKLANSKNKNSDQIDLDYNLALAKSAIEVTKNFKKIVEDEISDIENLKKEEIINTIKAKANLSEDSEIMIKRNQLIARLPILINSNEKFKELIEDVINKNNNIKKEIKKLWLNEINDYIAKYDKIRGGLGDDIDISKIYFYSRNLVIGSSSAKVFLELLIRSYEDLQSCNYSFSFSLNVTECYSDIQKKCDKEYINFISTEIKKRLEELNAKGFFKWTDINILSLFEKKDYKRLNKILNEAKNRASNRLEGLKLLIDQVPNSIKKNENQEEIHLNLMKENLDKLLSFKEYFDPESLIPTTVLKEELINAYGKANRKNDKPDKDENVNYHTYPNLTLKSVKKFLKIINNSEETVEEYNIGNTNNIKK